MISENSSHAFSIATILRKQYDKIEQSTNDASSATLPQEPKLIGKPHLLPGKMPAQELSSAEFNTDQVYGTSSFHPMVPGSFSEHTFASVANNLSPCRNQISACSQVSEKHADEWDYKDCGNTDVANGVSVHSYQCISLPLVEDCRAALLSAYASGHRLGYYPTKISNPSPDMRIPKNLLKHSGGKLPVDERDRTERMGGYLLDPLDWIRDSPKQAVNVRLSSPAGFAPHPNSVHGQTNVTTAVSNITTNDTAEAVPSFIHHRYKVNPSLLSWCNSSVFKRLLECRSELLSC
ncbi:hypothetical protein FBUS_05504 [Fasciolopsis buskii]|uniref:Uncharacterized protein n=1 Tax=Fasciolopsis buskii TaxID=27845 RepID=A0A8E0RLU0_9TREM|nr:hypothetical protein FBUS_05504 [Fasciolopsis buski]